MSALGYKRTFAVQNGEEREAGDWDIACQLMGNAQNPRDERGRTSR